MLDNNRIDYLIALTRKNRIKLEKRLERFAGKPGQSEEEVAEAWQKIVASRGYAAETEKILRGMKVSDDD